MAIIPLINNWVVMSETVLVTGGAGYIGSHTSYLLSSCGYKVIILDDLVYNQPYTCPWAIFIRGDVADANLLEHVFSTYNIDIVMHFAAFIEVGQSVEQPQRFYENNVIKTLQLLNQMLNKGINKFVFSSSCAVYGVPQYLPMNELHPFNPMSPYGKNKLIIEYALQDYAHAYNLQYVSLRYFNAAGGLGELGLGEFHEPETHVIPNLMRALLQDKEFVIFGDDYATNDGTCVRDYVHVLDIAHAHVLACEYMRNNSSSQVFNLGTGKGYTVKQLIEAAERVSDKSACCIYKERRAGDVPILIADNAKIQKLFGWNPKHSDLSSIMTSAYAWEKKRLGYVT